MRLATQKLKQVKKRLAWAESAVSDGAAIRALCRGLPAAPVASECAESSGVHRISLLASRSSLVPAQARFPLARCRSELGSRYEMEAAGFITLEHDRQVQAQPIRFLSAIRVWPSLPGSRRENDADLPDDYRFSNAVAGIQLFGIA